MVDKEKILIVDDQLFNVNALIIVLQYGVKLSPSMCTKATSGKAALQILESNINKN